MTQDNRPGHFPQTEADKFAKLRGLLTEPAATDAPAPQTPTADAPLNLNTAAKEELMLLPRIGETLAERILAYRAENGSFVSTEQLMDIDGIGEGTYNSIRDLVTVEDNP